MGTREFQWVKMETPKPDAAEREQCVRIVGGFFGTVLWHPEHNSIYWIHDGGWYIGAVVES